MENIDDDMEYEIKRRAWKVQEDAKELVYKQAEVKCPLAEMCGQGVYCNAENKLMRAPFDPYTIVHYCTDKFFECTSFLTVKKIEQDQKENAKKFRRHQEIQRDEDNATLEEADWYERRNK